MASPPACMNSHDTRERSHHLICVSCGATEDISRCGVDEVLDSVRQSTGYEIVGHRTEVYGVCPTCRAAARS